jgi:hypothetical protein
VNQKKKILGLNAARLYGIDVPAELQIADDSSAASNTAMENTSTSSDAVAAKLQPTPS